MSYSLQCISDKLAGNWLSGYSFYLPERNPVQNPSASSPWENLAAWFLKLVIQPMLAMSAGLPMNKKHASDGESVRQSRETEHNTDCIWSQENYSVFLTGI